MISDDSWDEKPWSPEPGSSSTSPSPSSSRRSPDQWLACWSPPSSSRLCWSLEFSSPLFPLWCNLHQLVYFWSGFAQPGATIEWWVNSVQEISSYDQAQWRCKRKPTGGFVCGAAVESLVCVTAPPDPQVEGGRWWERNWWRAGRPQLSPKTTCLDLSAHGLICKYTYIYIVYMGFKKVRDGLF